jgi:hypothetical protein
MPAPPVVAEADALTLPLEAPSEGMPPLVMRFVLLCGLLTVLGLTALIYLQL